MERHINFIIGHYTRLGEVALVCIFGYAVYRRIGSDKSFAWKKL